MPRAVIGRWGKNLAIRFPADVAQAADLRDGERVEIAASKNEVVIRKLPAELTIESMFAGKSPQAWRALYHDAYDWGPDEGRERIEESVSQTRSPPRPSGWRRHSSRHGRRGSRQAWGIDHDLTPPHFGSRFSPRGIATNDGSLERRLSSPPRP
jgi:antitoxin component of MazEF toxin-antitoxin module